MPGTRVQNDTREGRYITIRGLDSNLVGVTSGGVRVPSTDFTGRHVDTIESQPGWSAKSS